jgi:hypothetical protein
MFLNLLECSTFRRSASEAATSGNPLKGVFYFILLAINILNFVPNVLSLAHYVNKNLMLDCGSRSLNTFLFKLLLTLGLRAHINVF